ncbi:MAG: hypothetical protein QXN35_01055 [Ignisphaera sp.]
MKIVVGDSNTLEIIVSKSGRINASSYIVCYDIDGNLVFVPLKSSRHAHTIVVRKNILAEAIKIIGTKGFEILESCLCMPSE